MSKSLESKWIDAWDPEDATFWEKEGKRIARQAYDQEPSDLTMGLALCKSRISLNLALGFIAPLQSENNINHQ